MMVAAAPRRAARWAARLGVVVGATAAAAVAAATAADAVTADEMCPDSPFDCLPAWRWGPASSSFTNDPGMNPLTALTSGAGASVTGFLFAIARIVWTITLALVRFATSIDWLGTDSESNTTAVGAEIDRAFLSISELFGGFVWVLLIAGVVTVVIAASRRAVGGQGKSTWKEMIRPVVCMGMLVVMVQAAGNGVGTTWAPSWWIATSAQATGQIWDSTAGAVTGDLAQPPQWDPDRDSNDNSCDHVALALHEAGRKAAEGHEDDTIVAQFNVAELASTMWHSSHLSVWRQTQFDTTRSGARIYCWMLEDLARTPYDQQLALISNKSGGVQRPFLADPGSPTLRRTQYTNLAVCMRQGSAFKVAPEWLWWRGGIEAELIEECERAQTGASDNLEERLTGHSSWAAEGAETVGVFGSLARRVARVIPGVGGAAAGAAGRAIEAGSEAASEELRSGGLLGVRSTQQIEDYAYLADSGTSDQIQEAREVADYLTGLSGGNLSNSMAAGVMAIVVAVMYGLALGGVAFGATLAQMGAVVFWVFFSVIMLLGMWPTEAARSRFYRAIRLGIGLMLARFVMLGLMTAMVVTIAVFQAILDAVGSPVAASSLPIPVMVGSSWLPVGAELVFAQSAPGASWARGNAGMFFQALPPLVALIAFKRVFKELQFGNPTSFGGAMRMVGSVTTNGTDMSTFRQGRGMSMAKQRLHPMSPYGPFSLRRQTNRLRRAVGDNGPQKGKKGPVGDRQHPPSDATTESKPQRPDGKGNGKGDPGDGGGKPGDGGGKPGDGGGAAATDDAVDQGTTKVRSGVLGLLDRKTKVKDAVEAFGADHQGIAGLGRGAKRAAKFAVPVAVAGGALASFPLVGAVGGVTGALYTIGAYKGAKFAGRKFEDYAQSGRLGVGAGEALAEDPQWGDDALAVDDSLPAAAASAGSGARGHNSQRREGPPPPPRVPVPPPLPPDATMPSQLAPPHAARVQFPDTTKFDAEGVTQQGRYVQQGGTWYHDTGIEGERGRWYQQVEMPHPAMDAPPVAWSPAGASGPQVLVPGVAPLPASSATTPDPLVQQLHQPAPAPPPQQVHVNAPPAPAAADGSGQAQAAGDRVAEIARQRDRERRT